MSRQTIVHELSLKTFL